MTFFEELEQKTMQQQMELHSIPVIERALTGKVSLATYIEFLTQAYHHVKHTVPLLMSCGSRIKSDQEWLRTRVANYIEEEIGHQDWILNDIAACGGDAEAVKRGKPGFSTQMMVAYAYDSIARVNPISFFGMVYVLEGTSAKLATNAALRIQESLNLPIAAFSYLNSHGCIDLEHVDFFRDLVNQLESDTDKVCLVESAKNFYRLYGEIFRSLEAVQ
jgi:pyrroloquinoline quinone (PQQ) biosynthesis protein C